MYKFNFKIIPLIIILVLYAVYEGGKLPYCLITLTALIIIIDFIAVKHQKKTTVIKLKTVKNSFLTGQNADFYITAYSNSKINSCPVIIKINNLQNYIDNYNGDIIWPEFNEQKFSYRISFKIRGIYNIFNLNLIYKGFFRIFNYKNTYDSRNILKVYPCIHNINYEAVRKHSILYGALVKDSRAFDMENIKDIRKYIIGDNLKNIHWKISAKYSELYLKEPDTKSNKKVSIFLNMQKEDLNNEEEEELLVEACVSVVKFCMDNFIGAELFVYNNAQYKFEFSSITNEFEQMMNYFLKNKSCAESGFSDYLVKNIDKKIKPNIIILTSKVNLELTNSVNSLIKERIKVSIIYNNSLNDIKNNTADLIDINELLLK